MNAEALKQVELVSQMKWTLLILGFFSIQAIIWIVAISLVANDKSHAVIEGYDAKSANWQAELHQQRESEALGWNAEILLGDTEDSLKHREITLKLTDRSGAPIETASVNLTLFHTGHASLVQKLLPTEISPGIYRAQARFDYRGIYDFTLTAEVAQRRFMYNERQFLNQGKQ
ncbi:MAG TPA: FixH family protein [Pirellulaceae bacterium]|nr:FixH family protein [Pirellulaceae bacterium]HMO92678.1 FixH family protein [Pirellulaceae bacterium]HMP70574.1 FixH family protein [Pirellulaceae bacterium]